MTFLCISTLVSVQPTPPTHPPTCVSFYRPSSHGGGTNKPPTSKPKSAAWWRKNDWSSRTYSPTHPPTYPPTLPPTFLSHTKQQWRLVHARRKQPLTTWVYESTNPPTHPPTYLSTLSSNGGWCMHDEAAAHYVGMIDQTTLGHRFIASTFGGKFLPRVGWQVGGWAGGWVGGWVGRRPFE